MKSLVLLFTCFLLWSLVYAEPPKLEMAPLNPDFIKYMERLNRGEDVTRTRNGMPLGYIPPPMQYASRLPADFQMRYDLPPVYDLRNEGLLTPVKNQLNAGTCWAFAAMGSVESNWLRLGLGPYDLSENNLKNRHNYLFDPNNGGGNEVMATSYFSTFMGPVLEADDPYDPNGTTSPVLPPIANITDLLMIPGQTLVSIDSAINSTKQNLLAYGALFTHMYFDNSYYNPANHTYFYGGQRIETNHCILVAGWDDNKVTGASQPGAWIVRNSYGTGWGESGFFYLSYYDSAALTQVAAWPNRDPYVPGSRLYYYDDLGGLMANGYNQESAYGLIKFTTSDNQPITRVATWLGGLGDNEVSFWIYDNFNGTNLSGLMGELTGQHCDYPGYVTFDLPAPIYPGSGNDIYLKIKYTTPGWGYPIPIEAYMPGYADPVIESGKCWVSYTSQGAWEAIGLGTGMEVDLSARLYSAPVTDPPDIAVCTPAITFNVPLNGKTERMFMISNTAPGGAQKLIWEMEDRDVTVELALDQLEPAELSGSKMNENNPDRRVAAAPVELKTGSHLQFPPAADADINLVLDDGYPENVVGLTSGGQVLWLNRFTPASSDFPFQLTEVHVDFWGGSGVNVGELVDIYIYEDTDGDGDPGTNANFLASKTGCQVQAVDGLIFSQYTLPPVTLNGPGDVLIAVVNRTAAVAAGTRPALEDQTTTQQRSWFGAYAGGPGNPPALPAPGLWSLIDNLGMPGNWMVRGYGIFANAPQPCTWLSSLPENGHISAGFSQFIHIQADAAGMAAGTYQAELVITSNDPDEGELIIPVTLNVGQTISFNQQILNNWNMIGLPLSVANARYQTLFPNAIANTCYGWSGSYNQVDTLETGNGYWIKFPAGETVPVTGMPFMYQELELRNGWNMISGISADVPLTAVNDPGNLIIPGTLYKFDGAYQVSTTIEQGQGYWLKTSGAGTVTLSNSSKENTELRRKLAGLPEVSTLPHLILSDASGASQNLYFNADKMNAQTAAGFSLPPLPPAGAFDARFSNDAYVAQKAEDPLIQIQSSRYPVTIRLSENAGECRLQEISAFESAREYHLQAGEEIVISNPQVAALRLIQPEKIAHHFDVAQNYPNPFNPSTEIRFTLPANGKVEIVVFNTLGQQIKTLVSEPLKAGQHQVVWNGTNNGNQPVGSGIYFYRVTAGDFTSVRKMMLLR
ncbi:MAG: C1 family peptidase [Calditrichia bacterium]